MSLYRCRYLDCTFNVFQIQGVACENDAEAIVMARRMSANNDELIRLRDGIVSRVQLVAEIRWRIFWARFGDGLLLFVSVIAAVAAVIAAADGWK